MSDLEELGSDLPADRNDDGGLRNSVARRVRGCFIFKLIKQVCSRYSLNLM